MHHRYCGVYPRWTNRCDLTSSAEASSSPVDTSDHDTADSEPKSCLRKSTALDSKRTVFLAEFISMSGTIEQTGFAGRCMAFGPSSKTKPSQEPWPLESSHAILLLPTHTRGSGNVVLLTKQQIKLSTETRPSLSEIMLFCKVRTN